MKLRYIQVQDQYGTMTEPVLQVYDNGWKRVEVVLEEIEIDYKDDNKSKNLELELLKRGMI